MAGVTSRIAVELVPPTQRRADSPPGWLTFPHGEGPTEEAAMADLKEGLRGYIETFGLEDAFARLSTPSALRHLRHAHAVTRDTGGSGGGLAPRVSKVAWRDGARGVSHSTRPRRARPRERD